MSTPRIAAVATAVPPHRFTQTDILARAGYADDRRRGFFAASDIEGRHLWMDPARFTPDENVDQLNARFCEGALALSESAARATLERAGWSPADVDFVATTTCTGRLTPSIDAHLVARLQCRENVQRVHVGDTGCASAMVALQQASNHLQAFPGHRALVVAVEICSAARASCSISATRRWNTRARCCASTATCRRPRSCSFTSACCASSIPCPATGE